MLVFDFFHIVPWLALMELILSAYIIKLLVTPIAAIPATLLAALLKKFEGADVYDYAVDYNPFKR